MDVGVNRSAVIGGDAFHAFHCEAFAGTAPRKSIVKVDSGGGGAATPKTFASMSRARSTDAARSTSARFLPRTNPNDARHGALCIRRNVPGATFGVNADAGAHAETAVVTVQRRRCLLAYSSSIYSISTAQHNGAAAL